MSMEPSWVVPCDSGWSMEEAAAAWSSEDRISFQTSLPSHSDSVQLQVVEYASPATPTHNTCSDPIEVFEEATQVFNDNYFLIMGKKMHRFPPSLVDAPPWYKEPVTVAIGPHHHRKFDRQLEAGQVKHAAANQCIKDSTYSLQEMYSWVSSVSSDARNFYNHDDVATFSHHDDFVPMMFFDGCFLVQFMRWHYLPTGSMHEVLESYFPANHDSICTDIMMLENQIPWVVVNAILAMMPPAPSPMLCLWQEFVVAMIRRLKNQMFSDIQPIVVVDPYYEPPHLLGLVWFYISGKNKSPGVIERAPGNKTVSLSITVAELADVGITVVPPKEKINAGLVDMRLQWKLGCFQDLIVPPLCLTEANATRLINMAAFELCNTPEFDNVDAQYSAVCSYLHLFAMLMDQEKHVHELRENHVIEGGGLTSKETLKFFTSICKNMRPGKRYLDIIMKIEKSKQKKRSYLFKPYRFCIKHWTKIMAVVTVIGAVIGILSSLQALKLV